MGYADILHDHSWNITKAEKIALDSIWRELVVQTQYSNNTRSTFDKDNWEIVEYTPFTEPFWGKVVNK